MVIIKDELCPPSNWALGRILKVFPDQEGLVRIFRVRTSNGIFERPIVKLIPLPIECSSSN